MGDTFDTPLLDIPDDLERPEVIAAELKLSPKTLANQRSRGGGPPWVLVNPRTVRYSRRQVAEYIAALSAPRVVKPREHQD